jgi:iron complex transport system substrate-binding protein
MKRLFLYLLALLLALLLYQQFRGRGSTTPDANEGFRIVSLSPTLTEILFELGKGNQIVGVTNYCDYPPEVRQKERIGDLINPDLERIASLRPSLILAERWSSTKIVTRLQGMGFTVAELPSPRSIAEVFDLIKRVGANVGRQECAQEIVLEMKKRIEVIQERAGRLPSHPRLYVEIDLPSWTVGRLSYTHEAVTLCGARNVFGNVEKPALLASQESIIQRDPEIILSFDASAGEIGRRPGWASISAVREKKIIDDFERDLLSRGSFRLVRGMEELETRLEHLLDR